MPNTKQGKKGGHGPGSPEPGPSKREKYYSSDEEDDPFPKRDKDSRVSKQGHSSKKMQSKFSGGTNMSCHNKPAELFRKDLISAMKLADTEILYEKEYVVISDPWRQEWEKGVQVPVNEGDIMPTCVISLKKAVPTGDFKLPPRKFLHERTDEAYVAAQHELTGMQEMADQIVRYDLDDQDVQWLELVNEDREEMGLQLINEWNLERMIEELENQCYTKTNALKKTEEGLGIEYDEDVACDVCRMLESEDTNEMVFCDGCDICVHQACYGIQTIPEGTWLCRICALGIKPMCLLCPKRGGAMKPTKSATKWTHVSCALWIPEVSIGCPEKMEPITKISNIPTSRWALVCCLCKERVGACIQCSVKQCKTAFHVTCGFAHNLDMRTIVDETDDEDGIHLRAYCPKHTKNRHASDSDSPKKGKFEEEDENDEAEMAKKRMEKLNQLDEEFYTLVDIGEISRKFYIPEEAVDIVTEYWKLKRKVNGNKPLITPKMEEEDQMQRQQKDSLTARMKLFVHLRQDLERARNLCYMISKREKTKRQLFNLKEAVFHAQLKVLTDPDSNLSAREAERVRRVSRFFSIYCDLNTKHSPNGKLQRENVFTLENLKTPKDLEEEKEKEQKRKEKGKEKEKSKFTEEVEQVKGKDKVKSASAAAVKNVKKSKVEKCENKDSELSIKELGQKEVGDDLCVPSKAADSADPGKDGKEAPSAEVADKIMVEHQKDEGAPKPEENIEGRQSADADCQQTADDSPSKKNLIAGDLRKKLTSILQSKTMMQQRKERSESLTDVLHIDVENSDSEEITVSESTTEVPGPGEERMNLFDQFNVQDVNDKLKSPPANIKPTAAVLSPPPPQSFVDEPKVTDNVPKEEATSEAESLKADKELEKGSHRSSSSKKAKRRKHSRSSHKRKRPRSSVTPEHSPQGISPIIIKTEGDNVVSKKLLRDSKSPLSPVRSDDKSVSKSTKVKRKRSRRCDSDSEDTRESDINSPSSSKLKKRHHHRHSYSSPGDSINVKSSNSSEEITQQSAEVGAIVETSNPSDVKVRTHSKLRLKKQASPVKGVVAYAVVRDNDEHERLTPKPENGNNASKDIKKSVSDRDKNIFDCVKDNACSSTLVKVINDSVDSNVESDDSKLCTEKTKSVISLNKKSSQAVSKLDRRISKSLEMAGTIDTKEEILSSDEECLRDRGGRNNTEKDERKTRNRVASRQQNFVDSVVDDSTDENFEPDEKFCLDVVQSSRRLRARRQIDSGEGEVLEDTGGNHGIDAKGDGNQLNKDNHLEVNEKKKSSTRANGIVKRGGLLLRSPLPEKPEINELLLDPSKLVIKDSIRKRVGVGLASAIKGRSRWATLRGNQLTMDKFVRRTNSCENVFSKPDLVRSSRTTRLSTPLTRADLSPLSVNKSSSVVNNGADPSNSKISESSNIISPAKGVVTNALFGAHSSPKGSLKHYRIPRHSPHDSKGKDGKSPLGEAKSSIELDSETLFGDAEKLQKPGLKRQLSFENIGRVENRNSPDNSLQFSHGSSDLSHIMKTPSKCDSSELNEDHLDGSQSYRSPSPVSSVTSVASSRLGRPRNGRILGCDDEDDDEEEGTPSKRVTRSQLQEDALDRAESPSTRLRSRDAHIRPPRLSLS